MNASCDAVEIVIEGEPSHGAYPHRGRDPVLALCEAVLALAAAAGRRVDPLHPATITIGVLEAGTAENVIPAEARARGAVRAHRKEDREALRTLSAEVVAGVAQAHGCRGSVNADGRRAGARQRPRDRVPGAGASVPRRTRTRTRMAFVRLG